MGRKILALFLGLIAGGVVVALVETISSFLHPMPEDLDPQNIEQLKAFVASLPSSAFFFVLGAHLFGSLTSGLVSSMIEKKAWIAGALILGTIFTIAGVANLVLIPHPVWFAIIDVLIYIPAAYLGARIAGAALPNQQHENALKA